MTAKDRRRRSKRTAHQVAMDSDPGQLLPIFEGDETGSLMSQDVEALKPKDMNEVGKTHMMEVFGAESESDLPDRAYLIQHGKDAHRPGEAAEIINHGQYEDSKRNKDGVKVACYVVRYASGELKWFPQATPTTEFDTPLPLALRLIKPAIWAEMVPGPAIETQFRVKLRVYR